jgi:hypothetical protein
MSKLSDQEKSFILLLQRSPDRGDGWRTVSKMVWPLVTEFTCPELIELAPLGDAGSVRLTDTGNTVAAYLA